MSIPTKNKFHFSHSLPLKSNSRNWASELRIRRLFNIRASEVLLLGLERQQPGGQISNKTLKKYLVKTTRNVSTLNKSLPYYASPLRSSLKKLITNLPTRQLFFLNKPIAEQNDPGKILAECKRLETLDFKDAITLSTLRSIRKLTALKHLRLTLSNDDILKCNDMFRHTTSLEAVSLKIKKGSKIDGPEILASFHKLMSYLLKQKSLQYIYLDLSSHDLTGEKSVLEMVLSLIDKYKIPSFYISACLSPQNRDRTFSGISGDSGDSRDSEKVLSEDFTSGKKNHIDISQIRNILSQITCLTFLAHHLYMQADIIKMCKKSEKSLNLAFPEGSFFDISPILAACTSLKSLGVNEENLIYASEQCKIPKSLEDIIVDLTLSGDEDNRIQRLVCMLEDVKFINSFMISVSPPKDKSLEKFKTLHELLSHKQIKSYSLKIWNYWEEIERETNFAELCEPIGLMKSIENLHLSFQITDLSPLKEFEKMLANFAKLKNLDFSVSANIYLEEGGTFDIYFPFEVFSQMVSFRLSLSYPLSKTAVEHFAKNVSALKQLESLTIGGRTMDSISAEECKKLSNTVSKMKSLKHLSIYEKYGIINLENCLEYSQGTTNLLPTGQWFSGFQPFMSS